VGALNYLATITRPCIAYATSRLSKFLAKPTIAHKNAAKHLLRYLKQTKDLALTFSSEEGELGMELRGYTDSDFAADTDNRRSISGFCFLLHGACVHWQSKQQSLIARSTHQAEYIGMANASYEISYLRKLLSDLTEFHGAPTTLYADNQGAIDTATSPNADRSPRTKHIDIRYHITREALANGELRLEHVRSADMVADILTKPLPYETHIKHTRRLGLIPLSE
jgi:hypothetical protein